MVLVLGRAATYKRCGLTGMLGGYGDSGFGTDGDVYKRYGLTGILVSYGGSEFGAGADI